MQLTPDGTPYSRKAAGVNAYGIHLVYANATGIYYRRSADGTNWTSPAQIATSSGSSLQLATTDEGIVVLAPYFDTYIAVADAAGETWGPLTQLNGWGGFPVFASVRRAKLHLVYGSSPHGNYYRAVDPAQYADQNAYLPPVQLVETNNYLVGALFTRDEYPRRARSLSHSRHHPALQPGSGLHA